MKIETPSQTTQGAAAPAAPLPVTPTPITPTHDEFLRRIAASTIVNAQLLGWPAHMAAVFIAQACLESRWGGSTLAKEANNLFGVKAREGEAYWEGLTTEFEHGQKVKKLAKFARYETVNGAFARHAQLLSRDRYAAVAAARDCNSAAEALQKCGYATDPAYADKLKNLIRRYRFDDPARLAEWSGYPAAEWAGTNTQGFGTEIPGVKS